MEKLTREKMQQINREDETTVQQLSEKAETIKQRRFREIQEHYQKIEGKIKQLQNERQKIFQTPITKDELLEITKEELRGQRKAAVESILLPHLRGCQERRVFPFDPIEMRVNVFTGRDFWKLLYFIIAEKDVEEMIAQLPDDGLTAKDREKRMKEIDNQIALLSQSLEQELNV